MSSTITGHDITTLEGLIGILQDIYDLKGNLPVLAPHKDSYRFISHITVQDLIGNDAPFTAITLETGD